jgi:hypothetical protein
MQYFRFHCIESQKLHLNVFFEFRCSDLCSFFQMVVHAASRARLFCKGHGALVKGQKVHTYINDIQKQGCQI